MVRVDVTQLSFHGTWIDGYIPHREEVRRLARLYRDLDTDIQGLPQEYGFSQAGAEWSTQDYFTSIASAIRDKFDRDNMPPGVHPTPCFMWLARIDKEPHSLEVLPLYQEYLVDPRKEDYYHFITIHGQCPIEKNCLQQLMYSLQFETKPENAYVSPEQFRTTVYEVLNQYIGIIAAPQQEIKKGLNHISKSVSFSFT